MIYKFNWPLINIDSNFNPIDFLSGKYYLNYEKSFEYEIKKFDESKNDFVESALKSILNYVKNKYNKINQVSTIKKFNQSAGNIKLNDNFNESLSQNNIGENIIELNNLKCYNKNIDIYKKKMKKLKLKMMK